MKIDGVEILISVHFVPFNEDSNCLGIIQILLLVSCSDHNQSLGEWMAKNNKCSSFGVKWSFDYYERLVVM